MEIGMDRNKQPDIPSKSVYRNRPRYDYNAIEEFQPDNPLYGEWCPVSSMPIIDTPRTKKGTELAEKIVRALNHAFYQGMEYGKTLAKEDDNGNDA